MPRVRFAVEFEDVEGNVVVAFSDIPAQTKQEAIEKGFAYLNTLTPTATKQRPTPSLAEAIHASLNSFYDKMAEAAEQTKDAASEDKADVADVENGGKSYPKATKGKRKPKK